MASLLEYMQDMSRSLEWDAKPAGMLIDFTDFGESAAAVIIIVFVILGTVLVNQISRKCNDLLMFSFPTVTSLITKHCFFITVFGKSAAAVVIVVFVILGGNFLTAVFGKLAATVVVIVVFDILGTP